MTQEKLKPCPFCGSVPVTYFHFSGTLMGYPVLSAHIKCEKCGIVMPCPICYDTQMGMTSFKSMENGMEYLVGKWNERAILGKQFTADEVATILAITGQNDTKKFKLGEIIQYSPSEVKKILSNWKGSEEP